MIRCNNCGKVFKAEHDIPLLIQWENGETKLLEAGKMTRIKKGETRLRKGKEVRLQEIIDRRKRKDQ